MKRILILFIILLNIITVKLYSQCVVIWTQRYDSGNSDCGEGIAVDNNGYVYVTGYPGVDYFTIKYDSSGNTIWTQRYDNGGYALEIAVDNSGYVYVTGYANNGSDYDYCTIKYDSNGNTIWTQKYNSGGVQNDYAYGIAVDNNGNVYVTGKSFNISYDYCTIKYDSSGNTIWTQRYDSGNSDGGKEIAVDSTGNVYVTGYANNGTFDDYFTIKYDSSGNTIWTQRYDSGGFDDSYGIAVDNNGYVYVTGSYYYTIKYDSSGNTIWSRAVSGNISYGIAVDSTGNVYVTGYANNGSNDDYFIVKYDSSGNTIWTQRYDGGNNDCATAITIDNNGYVYVTGHANNGVNDDYFTIKYEQPVYPEAPTGIVAVKETGYIKLNWIDNTINERGFKIYRSYDGINYEVIGRVAAGITVYNDTGYDESRTNWYKVSATNLAGELMSSSIKWMEEEEVSNDKEYDISEVVLVPNPFYYRKDEDRGKITFYKVSEGVEIEIYSISGRKVRILRYDREGRENKIEWGVKDEYNRELATGVYIAKIKDRDKNQRYITFFVRMCR